MFGLQRSYRFFNLCFVLVLMLLLVACAGNKNSEEKAQESSIPAPGKPQLSISAEFSGMSGSGNYS